MLLKHEAIHQRQGFPVGILDYMRNGRIPRMVFGGHSVHRSVRPPVGTNGAHVIQVDNNGEKVMLHFALDKGGTVGVQMDATSAVELAQSLVIHAAMLERQKIAPDVKQEMTTDETQPKKASFESFMDNINQDIAHVTKGIKPIEE